MGRPRKYESPEEFDAAVAAYVAECREKECAVTWTGMALALGFTSRQAIDTYADYDGFSDSVKRAKLLVENSYENRLHSNSPTGAIFALKNMRWSDTQKLEHTGADGGPIQTEDVSDEELAKRVLAFLQGASR